MFRSDRFIVPQPAVASRDQINGTKKFSFANAIIRDVPISETGLQLIPKLDLLPGSIELMEVEDLLHEQSKSPFFSFLRAALAPLRGEYDYILLDCPPNFFSVTKNALFFADSYILPYLPDYLSRSGINVFARLLRKFQESVATHDPRMRGSRIRAIVVNRFRSIGNIYTQAITELKTQLCFPTKRRPGGSGGRYLATLCARLYGGCALR